MGLNDIELSPAILAAMYKSLLVESEPDELKQFEPPKNPAPPAPSVEQSAPTWKQLGNNQKQILIVVRYEDSPILPDTALNLLTNMLNACKLSLDDVAIVNFHNYQ